MGKFDALVGNQIDREPGQGLTVVEVMRTMNPKHDPLQVRVMHASGPMILRFYEGDWNVDRICLEPKLSPNDTTLRLRHLRKICDTFRYDKDAPLAPELHVKIGGKQLAVTGWELTEEAMILRLEEL